LLAVGCAPGRSVLNVTVSADPPLSMVYGLDVTVLDPTHTPQRMAEAMVAVNGPIPPQRPFSLVLPADISGTVTVKVDAVGVAASTSKMVEVRPSQVIDVMLDLGAARVASLGDACATGPCSALLDSCTVGVGSVTFSGGYCTTVCDSGQNMSNCI